MIRLAATLVALGALVSACSDGGEDAADPATTQAPPPAVTTTEAAPPGRPPTTVIVVDGDTMRRVRHAVVRAGKTDSGRVDRKGRVELELGARKRITIEAKARGYMPETTTVRLRGRHVLVRLYREELQWPVYGATPARTQAQTAIRIRPPFRPVWARGVGGMLEFPAVVWQGVAYVNQAKGYTLAISMRNGKVLWRSRVGTRMGASPAVVPERSELVVTTFGPGGVAIVDMNTGRVEWSRTLGKTEPSPVVRDGVAYFGATNGDVYALDVAQRRWRWVHPGGSKITSSPALVGNRLYYGDYSGRVVCLSARSGRTIWVGSAGGRVYGTVAVGGGRVYAPSVFSGLSALSASSGRLLWRRSVGAYLYSSPAYYRGRVYYGTYSGAVYASDAASGRVLWIGSAGGSVSGAIEVVGGAVYAGSFAHRITAWDWRSGSRLWVFPHGEYVPVSGNGGRLLMHGFSKLWAVVPKRR
ncbi:MAG TPA: PQQ-binding-like beta-propeller repeat protein [Gaiellaceae bacterium]